MKGMTKTDGEKAVRVGDLVNTPRGTGLVVGNWRERVLVTPTGQDGPYSTQVDYCEAWRPEELVRRGWRDKPE